MVLPVLQLLRSMFDSDAMTVVSNGEGLSEQRISADYNTPFILGDVPRRIMTVSMLRSIHSNWRMVRLSKRVEAIPKSNGQRTRRAEITPVG